MLSTILRFITFSIMKSVDAFGRKLIGYRVRKIQNILSANSSPMFTKKLFTRLTETRGLESILNRLSFLVFVD